MAGLTINDPAVFSSVIQSANILPGDIIQLADGIYRGDFTLQRQVAGLPGNPIKIMPRHPGKVVIDGSLVVNGNYVEIYDIDFTDSRTDRHLITNAIQLNTPGSALYGCSICDIHGYGGVRWSLGGPSEISENIIYNNGYRAADGTGHGHAIYGLNDPGGLKTIARNLFFKQFGKYSIHLYSDTNSGIALKDFHCIDNIICGHPVQAGGGDGLSNFRYDGNWQYQAWCQLGRYSLAGTNQDATILNNTAIQLDFFRLYDFQTVVAANNSMYECAEWPIMDGFANLPLPAALIRVIPFSKSKRWLGAIAIFNRDAAETVAVDLSSLLQPGSYRLRNGQNVHETWSFDYAGGSVDVPTGWTSAPRIGDDATEPTWPLFGGLVIEVVD